MSDEPSNQTQASPQASPDNQTQAGPTDSPREWELWVKITVVMAGIMAFAWGLVLLRLGTLSVYTHALILSTLGSLSVPVTLWGLIKALFNRPLVRRSRVIGFGLLMGIALFGNVPMFAAPLSTEDWESNHTYRLPFDGPWAVTAGGDDRATNYHATTATYRWAYDFTRVEDGQRDDGSGELDGHHCVGQPVLAAAAGEVVTAEDGHADNAPGEFDEESVLGNHVVIAVDDGEYLYTAHLKEGSVAVEEGARVGQGDKIGECGNSGRSLNPHVHVHLQNTLEFPFSESLPLRFSDYTADGDPVDIGMPEGPSDQGDPFGQRVAPR